MVQFAKWLRVIIRQVQAKWKRGPLHGEEHDAHITRAKLCLIRRSSMSIWHWQRVKRSETVARRKQPRGGLFIGKSGVLRKPYGRYGMQARLPLAAAAARDVVASEKKRRLELQLLDSVGFLSSWRTVVTVWTAIALQSASTAQPRFKTNLAGIDWASGVFVYTQTPAAVCLFMSFSFSFSFAAGTISAARVTFDWSNRLFSFVRLTYCCFVCLLFCSSSTMANESNAMAQLRPAAKQKNYG